jgi:hypothetical protein
LNPTKDAKSKEKQEEIKEKNKSYQMISAISLDHAHPIRERKRRKTLILIHSAPKRILTVIIFLMIGIPMSGN